MKKIKLNESVVVLISLMLCSFFAVHGYGLLLGDEFRLQSYLNFLSKDPRPGLPNVFIILFRLVGILGFFSAILFILSLITKEPYQFDRKYKILRSATFVAIITIVSYGALVRIYSNQQGSANLFFFSSLLYLLLIWLNDKAKHSLLFLKNIYWLPWYGMLFYTMGIPGFAKIFGGDMLRMRYVEMFKSSFVPLLPGGTSMMIIILGILELSVPILLLISIAKREFMEGSPKFWLKCAMIITILTFTMLSFGLSILFNFAGSSNLIFYSLFTFLMFMIITDENINVSKL